MPLFECSKCRAVDNTALGNYWWDTQHEGKPPLCAECDPEIGQWHGHFEKVTASDFTNLHPKEKIDYPWPKNVAEKPTGEGR